MGGGRRGSRLGRGGLDGLEHVLDLGDGVAKASAGTEGGDGGAPSVGAEEDERSGSAGNEAVAGVDEA